MTFFLEIATPFLLISAIRPRLSLPLSEPGGPPSPPSPSDRNELAAQVLVVVAGYVVLAALFAGAAVLIAPLLP